MAYQFLRGVVGTLFTFFFVTFFPSVAPPPLQNLPPTKPSHIPLPLLLNIHHTHIRTHTHTLPLSLSPSPSFQLSL